ncbi:hypothetical protein GG804_02135 [Sphingomonas histidinilytica]|uniref:macro domain-containing protein n=1 Tax=Rhizorhabdus histidinilytica TaxID=439228 RepID=UPI001AD96DCD|nr:macro domain-containing protein [Rhizorhabdus histidinilytica]MBO9375554.1 hypothetical protein [Rhizorhabdus histidinilytica]
MKAALAKTKDRMVAEATSSSEASPSAARWQAVRSRAMIEHIRGDMLEASAHILVNAVNCVGVMGAGVALAFKRHYPAMFLDYQRACRAGMVRPGRLHVWQSATGRLIVNLPTKRHWRDASRYEDVESGLDALHDFVRPLGPTTIALPALGCGHGGLDWARVSPIIHRKLGDLEAHIVVYAPGAKR